MLYFVKQLKQTYQETSAKSCYCYHLRHFRIIAALTLITPRSLFTRLKRFNGKTLPTPFTVSKKIKKLLGLFDIEVSQRKVGPMRLNPFWHRNQWPPVLLFWQNWRWEWDTRSHPSTN